MASEQTGWRGCSKCAGLVFFGSALCPSGGVHDHSTSSDYTLNFARTAGTQQLQSDWRWCNKCQTLSYTGSGSPPGQGPCAAGGRHDHSGSGNYGLTDVQINQQGQANWRWCRKCQGLYYAGTADNGTCLAGGAHDGSASSNYVLSQDGRPAVGDGQARWHWCRKCMMLAFDGYATCAGGGSHINAGSSEHVVAFDSSVAAGQRGWRWCNSCYSLVYVGTGSQGTCPGRSGGHSLGGSGQYVLPTNDSAASVGSQLKPGWKWCSKCQMIWSTEAGGGRCPSTPGGVHISEGSGDYLVGVQRAASTATATACSSPGGCPPTSAATAASAETGGRGPPLSPGAIAGISAAVGALVLFALIAAVLVWMRRRGRGKSPPASDGHHVSPWAHAAGHGALYADAKYAPHADGTVAELAGPLGSGRSG